jgi:hypothetical protein
MKVLIIWNLVDIPYISHTCYESCPFETAPFYRPKAYCLVYKRWNVNRNKNKKESLALLTNDVTERDSQFTNNAE